MFPTPFTARYIRIYSFYYEGHEEHIRCHKFELIGCLNDGILIFGPRLKGFGGLISSFPYLLFESILSKLATSGTSLFLFMGNGQTVQTKIRHRCLQNFLFKFE